MVLRIRLARFGNKHQPFYNIVVAQARPSTHCAGHGRSGYYRESDETGVDAMKENQLNWTPLTRLSRSARGAKPLEVIGTYNPIPTARTDVPDANVAPRSYKDITLDKARAKYWLGVGAQASDPVWKLLNLARLVEPKPKTYNKA
ncbi:Ribosomal protein S16 [Penicillium argentinense]|uniref:Ribosomal protein S16 n=1 Tax=Penicillium argentinense TaxID=1131581 RepID=A0A9W9KC12_9EURO|nr:Ribosomal protein S16 [Penicillium argentinense]KAJ5099497.1 Ribosomal protein S16 [Penicillium argentinense]